MKTDTMTLLLILIAIIVLLIASPLINILCINILFNTNTPINLWTYLASLWLTSLVAGGSIRPK
jgi:hypothetical protein